MFLERSVHSKPRQWRCRWSDSLPWLICLFISKSFKWACDAGMSPTVWRHWSLCLLWALEKKIHLNHLLSACLYCECVRNSDRTNHCPVSEWFPFNQFQIQWAFVHAQYCAILIHGNNNEQYLNIKIDNKSFKTVEQFKYFGTTVTNRNSIQEEIKSRLKSRNACYHSCRSCVLQFAVQIYKH